MPQRYRVENWSEYNQALIGRGSLTFWISEEVIRGWTYQGPTQQGGQYRYSDPRMETCLSLRLVYSLALRQTQGFVHSLLRLLDLDLPVPSYSTLSRRPARWRWICVRGRRRRKKTTSPSTWSSTLRG